MAFSWRFPAALALGVAPLVLSPRGATVLGWTALVVLLAAVDVFLAASPRALVLSRDRLGAVRLTETAASVLTIANPTRRTARLSVRDAWTASAGAVAEIRPLSVPAGEARRTAGRLRPRRRGDFAADLVTIRSFGPLGLAGRQRSVAVPGRLRVLPEFRSRRHLPSRLVRLRELDGRTAAQVRGQGTEFDSLREYALGDDVRSIDWRASARAEHVQVRTWRPERDRRVLIMLDTSRWAAGRVGDQTRLDAGIETALLLGALAGAAGDRVELLAADREVRARTGGSVGAGWSGGVAWSAGSAGSAGSVGAGVLASLADQLALVEPALVEANWTLISAQLRARGRGRALAVLITGTDPALVEVGLGPALEALLRRHVVMVAAVRDPGTALLLAGRANSDAVFDAAAAERRGLAVAAMESRLRAMGAHVVTALPEALPPAVADAYLGLKAAGRL
ncbi:MAG: DUF58 domain-containing protein [Bifidobacteriaceae bacterium]|jgi:uncharacterized protein (DUF58 family)|nr:DUF58 domain-containing protein [Bifidobacteriaceae bacterium]